MIQNVEHAIPWLLEPIISPTSIITTVTVFVGLLFMLGLRSGIGFEGLFDTLHIYWVSNKIRKTKELFQTKSQIQKQTDWVEQWEYLDEQREFLRQRDYFLRETFLDYAAKDKLEELEELDNYGPKLWEDKLADSRARLWLNEQKRIDLARSRQWRSILRPLHFAVPLLYPQKGIRETGSTPEEHSWVRQAHGRG